LLPTDLHVEYYRQRASAGLIITEATWISREAIGFINVPGFFNAEQVSAWRKVTDAVHDAGGHIFVQLMHSGASSHPDFIGGALPLAPSAINPQLRSFTESGFKETVTPAAMTKDDIARTIGNYVDAARNALDAGFDGAEIHGAGPYLIPQFLNSALNVRDDNYGGSPENRARFVIDLLDATVSEVGPHRVGIKLSPTIAMGGFGPTGETVETYNYLISCLANMPLSHVQIVKASTDLSGTPIEALQDTVRYYRDRYPGTVIANCGYDQASANAAITNGGADLVSFGKPFIGNPDLVRRMEHGLPLSDANPELFYQGGAEGYIDYPLAP
jgi:N-ethylmaleimide reductase